MEVEENREEGERMEDSEVFREPDPTLSRKTVLILTVCVICVFAIVLLHFALKMNTDPEKECVYRGGKWVVESKECVFEDGVGGGVQQVGMTIPHLELQVPNTESKVSFDAVEIGSSKVYTQTFVLTQGGNGSVSLINTLARVHGNTGDLVLPFTVQVGGTGSFIYLGIFSKEGSAYILKDSLFVGDRLGLERLMLAEHRESGVYTARFFYRDRRPTEALSSIAREPKTLEVEVKDHHIRNSFVLGRDGVEYTHSITIMNPGAHKTVVSPLLVTGTAQSAWFSKGSFSVTLRASDGTVFAQGIAHAGDVSTTSDRISFSATITFTTPQEQAGKEGVLHIEKGIASPSAGQGDSFEIPVIF